MRVPVVRGRLPWSGVASFCFFPTCLLTFTSPSVLKPSVVSSWMGVCTDGRFLVAVGVLGDLQLDLGVGVTEDLRVDLAAGGPGDLRFDLDARVLGDPRLDSNILALPFVLRDELKDNRYGIRNPGGNWSSELGPRVVAGGGGAGGLPELDGPG